MASQLSRRRALVHLGALSGVSLSAACRSGRFEERGSAEPARAPGRPAVRKIRSVAMKEGDGAVVQRLFPTPYLRHLDPFVLLDDFDVSPPAGFPTHPHRGFEAFTYMRDGAFHHTDNLGNDSVVGAGGTQRFTSGSGAWHSEMPGTDGPNRGLQLWVNLPRRLKKMTPSYAGEDPSRHPVERRGGADVRTVVGRGSPVELQTPVRYYDVALQTGASFDELVEEGYNAIVYVLDGAIRAAGLLLRQRDAILPRSGPIEIVADTSARFVFLAGKPHHEPIVHRGPFVD